jgi:hypothetical protein
MRNAEFFRSAAIAAILLAATPALTQNNPDAADTAQTPDPSALSVGALHTGASPDLTIAGIDISVAGNSVVYSYYLQNTASSELALAATVALPELQASTDGSETWVLSSNDAENPVSLSVTAAGAPVTTTPQVRIEALDIDRTAAVKAEHLPLIPFGPAIDKALAALSPDVARRLAAMGVVSPRDPDDPSEPVVANWTLKVVHAWRLTLPPNKTTPLAIKFTPVVGRYKLAKGDQDSLDEMKDDLCLKPPALTALQTRLKNGGAWQVTELSVASDAPNNWNDSPNPTLSVQKPEPGSIVAFCGIDEKSAGKPVVLGTAADDSQDIRIVIFAPAK